MKQKSDISDSGDSVMPEVGEGFGGGFSDYRELRRNGITRCGRVTAHGRVWFVKSLCSPWADASDCRARLAKEFELLVSLNHPGVVRALHFGEIPEAGLSIVMEMLDGVTLTQFLSERHPLAVRREVARQLLEAVAYLHSVGVVHLDLKPDNVMVCGGEHKPVVKIVDFGLGDAPEFAVLKAAAGTRRYAAPEQLTEGYRTSPRADVYALGRIVSELHAGIAYGIVARQAMNENPEGRPASAGEMSARERRLHRALRALWMVAALTVCAFVLTLLWITVPAEKSETSTAVTDMVDVKKDTIVTAAPAMKPARSGGEAKTDGYDTAREKIISELAAAYRNDARRINRLCADRSKPYSERYDLAMEIFGTSGVSVLKKFTDFLAGVPKSYLRGKPVEWQSPLTPETEAARNELNVAMMEINRQASDTTAVAR